MSIYVYIYRYIDDEIQGKGMNVAEYLGLTVKPGIYYKYDHNEKWSVLKVNDYGGFNTLHREEVPNEVKLHHLLTN